MAPRIPKRGKAAVSSPDPGRLSRVVAEARQARESRAQGYRDQALKLYPWVCGRCGREFTQENVVELTVHHRDHDHDHNPSDGSNWELLCIYCHDNEHARHEAYLAGNSAQVESSETKATHKPFAALEALLRDERDDH